jgi:alkanesulfonate monooxygenase SsuD/methylene tetrahydromethanopterin reductase-like flavin-dependent oxidoreductase (luciferase family)
VADFAATSILLARLRRPPAGSGWGTQVTPVPRRRPRQLAREIATLDRLSGGRMILGVGRGDPVANEYGRFGEPVDPKVLAGMLDEGLDAITCCGPAAGLLPQLGCPPPGPGVRPPDDV